MDVDQQARWQHVVLLAALVGTFMGGCFVAIDANDDRPGLGAFAAVGASIFVASIALGTLSFRSLRAALRRVDAADELDRGAFAASAATDRRLASLNARVARHFGLPPALPRPAMPPTFGGWCDAVGALVRERATIGPAAHGAARDALAAAIGVTPASIAWGVRPADLFPRGRARAARWERLRAAAPALPPATINLWVENVAIYTLIGLIVVGAGMTLERFNDDAGPRHELPLGLTMLGHEGMLYLVAGVAAALMVPVYAVGRRYAARLPAVADEMAGLARFFATADAWTPAAVAEHLGALVAAESGVSATALRPDTRIDFLLGR